MPDGSEATQRAETIQVVAHALLLDHAAAQLVRRFRERDIPSILLRGPVLASALYRDGSIRGYVDVDLLLPAERFAEANALLAEAGFEPVLTEESVAYTLPADAWQRPGDEIAVDLHRTIGGVGVPTRDAWRTLSEHVDKQLVGGEQIAVLTPPGLAVVVALHVGWHGPEHVKPMEDLARALEVFDRETWEQGARLAERLDALSAFVLGLSALPAGRQLTADLGLPPPTSVAAHLRARGEGQGSLVFERLREARGRDRARLIAAQIAPSKESMRFTMPLARKGWWGLALAYPWRLLLVIVQFPGAFRRWLIARRQVRSS